MRKLIHVFSAAALLCAAPMNAQNKVHLNTLNLNLMTTEYGSVRADRSCENRPLTINGKTYKGVGTHAYSKMIVSLQGTVLSGPRRRGRRGVSTCIGDVPHQRRQ